nr:hypothetical protein [Desulfobacterales bacterium]
MKNFCLDNAAVGANVVKTGRENATTRKGPKVFSYKLALVAVDLSAILGTAFVVLWAQSALAHYRLPEIHQTATLAFYLIPLVFFPDFRLYSYHLIFSPKYHLANLVKAGALGFFALLAIAVTSRWEDLMAPELFFPAVIGFSLTVLLANHVLGKPYREQNITVLLKALGLSFCAVGLFELTGFMSLRLIMLDFREIIFSFFLAGAMLVLTRCFMVHLVFNTYLRRNFRRQALLIGMNEDAERITDIIIRRRAPFWIAGTVC